MNDWLSDFLRSTPFDRYEVMHILDISDLDYTKAIHSGYLGIGVLNFDDPFTRNSGHSVWDMSLFDSALRLKINPYEDYLAIQEIEEALDDLASELETKPDMPGSTSPTRILIYDSLSGNFVRHPIKKIDSEGDIHAALLPVLASLISRALQVATSHSKRHACTSPSSSGHQLSLFPELRMVAADYNRNFRGSC